MYSKLQRMFFGALFLLGSSGAASASFISADFRSEFDLPDNPFTDGPRVFESIGEPVAGAPDLDSVDEIANPSNFSGFATTDLDADGLITLTGDQSEQGFANFDLAVFEIANIVFGAGESIIGVNIVSEGLLDPDFVFGVGVFAPSISFTANSVTITYDTTGSGIGSDFQFLDGGSSTFQVITTTSLPEPATIVLFSFGLLGLGVAARRHTRSSSNAI